ncbi:DUF4352 domain-containing protein [Microbacterium sp. NPDC019599]|uniref:DUF4352 domain-containing protein n=1 Tax=Microbacterium sp. NPDC019599 TaxID=3154690 RepID=UPI003402724D
MVAARSARLTLRRPRSTAWAASIAAALLCLGLSACTAAPTAESAEPDPTRTSAATTPAPTASASPSASGGDQGQDPAPTPGADPDQPIPKVGRGGEPVEPTQSAEPEAPSDPVSYPDGVTVRITDVSFGEETAKGPGSFPGRGYARLTLELSNGSSEEIDLNTSVLTVLDKDDNRVQPVYADEADVQDFAGTLASGKSTTAVYAFAVPDDSHSQITLVVDFDADHTSAVFRGGID